MIQLMLSYLNFLISTYFLFTKQSMLKYLQKLITPYLVIRKKLLKKEIINKMEINNNVPNDKV